jgi:phosphate:Na+ symporter
MDPFHIIGSFVGGLGLFLLGMHMMTEGMKVAAGRALRDVLARWTSTRLRALGAGIVITGLVQSSSAVTVATLGFVNAGLLELSRAIWVIFGSNVGTTMTGWLVALTGLEVDLEAYALPVVGVGMLLRLTGRSKRRGALGEALAGFGLFFLGLSALQAGFGALGREVDLSAIPQGGIGGGVLFFLVGTVLTVATQSSSAAIALTLSAATGEVVSLESAAAMVIGANLGTTSTAVFSVVGATPAAKRVASAHVVFNVVTAVAALLTLPWLVDLLVQGLMQADGHAGPATVLAAFHTVFNVLGVLLMVPLSAPLLRALEGRFVSEGEAARRPRHLDATIIEVPAIAFAALQLETRRLGHQAVTLLADVISKGVDKDAAKARHDDFVGLLQEISTYVGKLNVGKLSPETADGLQALVRAAQRYLIVVEQAVELTELLVGLDEEGWRDLAKLVEAAEAQLDVGDPESTSFDLGECQQAFGGFSERYAMASEALPKRVISGELEAAAAVHRRHVMGELRRGVKQVLRAAERLALAEGRPAQG